MTRGPILIRRCCTTVLCIVAALLGALLVAGHAGAAESRIYHDGIPTGMEPWDITSGGDGAMWFSGIGGIGRITPDGAVTTFTEGLAPGAAPTGVASAPDGSVWFADPETATLGRITPAGAITTYPTGLPDGDGPFDIAVASNGDVWFTAPASGAIGRVSDPDAPVQWVTGLPWDAEPLRITIGPHDVVWYTDYARDVVGHIALGFHDEIPVEGRGPLALTTGPAGFLFYAAYDSPGIGRISPGGGDVAFFPVPAGPGVTELTIGPDGDVWYVRDGAVSPGRMSILGGQRPPLHYPGGHPLDDALGPIAAGPGGYVWATVPLGDRIVRFTPDPPPAARPPAHAARPSPPGAPTVLPLPVSGIGRTTATINALASGHGAYVAIDLEYGPTAAYGTLMRNAITLAPQAGAPVRASRALIRLKPGTLYHFRLTARSTGGTTAVTGTFRTSPAPAIRVIRIMRGAVIVHANSAGTARVRVLRDGRPIAVRSRRALGAGPLRIPLGQRRLAPGTYRIDARLRGAAGGIGHRSVVVTLR